MTKKYGCCILNEYIEVNKMIVIQIYIHIKKTKKPNDQFGSTRYN